MNENLKLWNEVRTPDPKYTKKFVGKGGFSGTAISGMFLIRQATEVWGPMGEKWGIRVISQDVIQGAPILGKDGEVIAHEMLHVVLAEVYHPGGAIPCFGQTQLVGQRKDGRFFTDEDAPKKSLTDALTKGLSWLGFAADVHMGLFDDNKYVEQTNQEFREEERDEEAHDTALKILEEAVNKGYAALDAAWKTLSVRQCKQVSEAERNILKERARAIDAKRGKQVANA